MATIAGAVRVVCEGRIFGHPWVNVFHCGLPSPWDASAASDIADEFENFYDAIDVSLVNTWSLDTIELTDVSSATGAQFLESRPLPGTLSTDGLSAADAMLVRWSTALRGRSYRGRTFLCGFGEGSNDAQGSPVSGTAVNVAAAANGLVGALAINGTPLGVGSYTLGVLTPVTEAAVPDYWAVQRGRRNVV